MKRYQIQSMRAGCDFDDAIKPLRDEHKENEWHDTLEEASQAADSMGQDYADGVIIIDHEKNTIDWGHTITDRDGVPV